MEQIERDFRNKLVEYQLFPRQYFSGSDAYIIIGNTVVEEIKSLEVELMQGVSFIYGYASYTADAVAYGSRMVQGRLTINFKENGYLMSILEGASKSIVQGAAQSQKATEPITSYTSEAEYIAGLVKSGNYDKLKDAMQQQEDIIWGKQSLGSGRDKYREATLLPNKNYSDIKRNGFDIIISYGDAGFHVGDTIGEIPSTVEVINGVHLNGYRKIIEPTGESIVEEYTFLAKDFNNKIRNVQQAVAPIPEATPKKITKTSNPVLTDPKSTSKPGRKESITILSE